MSTKSIDVEKVCRLCLRKDYGFLKMISIYEKPDLEKTILNCVQIEVILGSCEPTNICEKCVLSLDSWSKFKMMCDSANVSLQSFIQDKNKPNNNIVQQQSNEDIDTTCTALPNSKCIKKVQPSDELVFDTMSGKECMNIALNEYIERDNNVIHTKAHCLNPKAISMKTMQKKNENKYNLYCRKTYCCNLCPEKYSKFIELLNHDSTVHCDVPKKFSCKTCGKMFLNIGRLEVHERVHRKKLFQCQLCQKKFVAQKTLNNHMNIHIGLYSCQTCGYKAHNMTNLKVHENTHSAVKNYSCNDCEREFTMLSSLRRHNRLVHQKSEFYRCDQCDFSTNHSSNLKHHKSTHSLLKFICEHCGLWYKTTELLKKHSKTHMDLQFQCTLCNKLFKQKSSLKIHLNNNHEPINKKYKCSKCQKYFKCNRNLRLHINKKVCLSN